MTSTTSDKPSSKGLGGRLSRLAAPLLIAVAIQSAANLIFHAVVGRSLPAADYGALGAVLSAMTLVAVPLSALQTAAARTTAASGLTRATAWRAINRVALYSLPAVALLLLLAGPIRSYLSLPTMFDAAILAPTLIVATVISVARGLLLGGGRSGVVAASFLLATAVRLGPGLYLAHTWGVTGALVATLAGEAAGLALVLYFALGAPAGGLTRLTGGDVLKTAVVVAGLFAFSTIDLFLARHHLSGTQSGFYVAAATIGKTVLALPAAALSVAYPKLVAAWPSRMRLATLRSALLVVGLPALAGVAFVALFPSLVLTVLYGGGVYLQAATLTRVLAIVAGTSAFVSVFAHAALARGSRWSLYPWFAAAVEIILIEWRHADMIQVAQGSVIALLVALIGLGTSELIAWRRPGPLLVQPANPDV